MKILCLINNDVKPGDRWLWKYLPSNNDELDFVIATGVVDRFRKWGKLINYYPGFMRAGLQAFLKTQKTHYDLVVAWGGAKRIYLCLTSKYLWPENAAVNHLVLQPAGRSQSLSRNRAVWNADCLTCSRFYAIRS